MKPLSLVIFVLAIAFTGTAQQTCTYPASGTYYGYPKNSEHPVRYVINGDKEIEYELNTRDSTIYSIPKTGDCKFTLKYRSGSKTLAPATLQFLQEHNVEYEIINSTRDYIVYRSYIDKIPKSKAEYRHLDTDTIWFREQPGKQTYIMWKPLTEKPAYLKKNFNDTSSYAIVYLYRPGNFVAHLNEYYVYLNDNLIHWAQNKTAGAYKIYLKGAVIFSAKSGNEESVVPLNLQPGKSYYIQCIIHHKLTRATPELKLMSEEEGRQGYEKL